MTTLPLCFENQNDHDSKIYPKKLDLPKQVQYVTRKVLQMPIMCNKNKEKKKLVYRENF